MSVESRPCATESLEFAGMLIEGAEIEQAITNVSIDGLTPSVGADMCSNATSELIHTHALVNNRGGIGEAENDDRPQFVRRMSI